MAVPMAPQADTLPREKFTGSQRDSSDQNGGKRESSSEHGRLPLGEVFGSLMTYASDTEHFLRLPRCLPRSLCVFYCPTVPIAEIVPILHLHAGLVLRLTIDASPVRCAVYHFGQRYACEVRPQHCRWSGDPRVGHPSRRSFPLEENPLQSCSGGNRRPSKAGLRHPLHQAILDRPRLNLHDPRQEGILPVFKHRSPRIYWRPQNLAVAPPLRRKAGDRDLHRPELQLIRRSLLGSFAARVRVAHLFPRRTMNEL